MFSAFATPQPTQPVTGNTPYDRNMSRFASFAYDFIAKDHHVLADFLKQMCHRPTSLPLRVALTERGSGPGAVVNAELSLGSISASVTLDRFERGSYALPGDRDENTDKFFVPLVVTDYDLPGVGKEQVTQLPVGVFCCDPRGDAVVFVQPASSNKELTMKLRPVVPLLAKNFFGADAPGSSVKFAPLDPFSAEAKGKTPAETCAGAMIFLRLWAQESSRGNPLTTDSVEFLYRLSTGSYESLSAIAPGFVSKLDDVTEFIRQEMLRRNAAHARIDRIQYEIDSRYFPGTRFRSTEARWNPFTGKDDAGYRFDPDFYNYDNDSDSEDEDDAYYARIMGPLELEQRRLDRRSRKKARAEANGKFLIRDVDANANAWPKKSWGKNSSFADKWDWFGFSPADGSWSRSSKYERDRIMFVDFLGFLMKRHNNVCACLQLDCLRIRRSAESNGDVRWELTSGGTPVTVTRKGSQMSITGNVTKDQTRWFKLLGECKRRFTVVPAVLEDDAATLRYHFALIFDKENNAVEMFTHDTKQAEELATALPTYFNATGLKPLPKLRSVPYICGVDKSGLGALDRLDRCHIATLAYYDRRFANPDVDPDITALDVKRIARNDPERLGRFAEELLDSL